MLRPTEGQSWRESRRHVRCGRARPRLSGARGAYSIHSAQPHRGCADGLGSTTSTTQHISAACHRRQHRDATRREGRGAAAACAGGPHQDAARTGGRRGAGGAGGGGARRCGPRAARPRARGGGDADGVSHLSTTYSTLNVTLTRRIIIYDINERKIL